MPMYLLSPMHSAVVGSVSSLTTDDLQRDAWGCLCFLRRRSCNRLSNPQDQNPGTGGLGEGGWVGVLMEDVLLR
jgi:hypothetical protein